MVPLTPTTYSVAVCTTHGSTYSDKFRDMYPRCQTFGMYGWKWFPFIAFTGQDKTHGNEFRGVHHPYQTPI